MNRLSCTLAGLALCGLAQAADILSLRAEDSRLGASQPDWHEQSLTWQRNWQPRHGAEVTFTRVRRFGLEDTRAAADYSRPLAPDLTLGLEAAASPAHHVLARATGGARLAWEFEHAWLLNAGLRASRYDEGLVRQASLGLERYAGAFSASLAWLPAQALGASTSSVVARGNWYYAERSSLGVTLASGREATRVAADRLVLADVRTAALAGRHAIAPAWGLGWSLERTRQGDFYTRRTVGLSLQHEF